MPRGSKPGERRGGRKRATPNKRTVLRERILAIASANPIIAPHDILLRLVNDLVLAADIRLAVGRKLFQAGRERSSDDRSKKKRPPIHLPDSKPASDHGRETSQPGTATRLVARVGPATFPTLDLLLHIAQDATATPAERCKAASEVAQYLLPKKNAPRRPRHHKFPPDECGFSVNPNWAKELRDTKWKLACLPRSDSPYAVAQKTSKLQARIKEIQESLQCPCPSKYRLKYYIGRTEVQAEIVRDGDRLKILQKRRLDKKTFSPEEDLEEAIRTARYDSFMEGPEIAARKRLADLRERKRAADKEYGPPLSHAEATTFRYLALLYPPPRRHIDEQALAEHWLLGLPVEEENARKRRST